MKRLLISIILFLLVIPLALAVKQTIFSQDNLLRIDFVSYTPSPAILGSEATLKFEVTNVGSEILKNQMFITAVSFPLEIIGENAITFEELKVGETKEFKFKIKVNPNAEEGTYRFILQFETPTVANQVIPASFDINVKRLKRTIASTRIATEPEHIPPGGTALINVEIENNADFSMKDVEVKLNFSDTVPLAPYQSTSQKQINQIISHMSETVQFQVIALPDAEPNVYKLPLSITFDDELGNENKREEYIGIIISKTPEYDLTIEDSTLIRGIKDKITISISNIGPSNLKYLVLEILPSKHYTILNPPRTYIGNLEPDDYETAEFDFYPKKSGSIPIQVKLEYKDDLNNPISETREIQAYIYSQTYAKALGLIPSHLIRNIFIILIIIFIYFTYKSWKTTRNIQSAAKQSLLKMLTIAVNIVRRLRWNYIKRIPRKIKIFFVKLQ